MIPALQELKQYPNWVCWRQQKHPTKPNKFKKPIISAVTGTNGSHSNSDDWTTFAKAKSFFILNKDKMSLKGIGFVFSENTPFVGIDIDECITNGILSEFAQRQLDTHKSYAQYSTSGNGIHIIGKCDLKFDAITTNKRGNQIEIYSRKRYFAMTGDHIPGTPDKLLDITSSLKYRVSAEVETPDNDEITIDDVNEMLRVIPGEGLDYNEWLHILMAVHSEFPGADGLAAVETWTGKFCSPNELQQKFASFRKGGVGIGTLVHFAKERGYTRDRLDDIRPKLTAVQKAQTRAIVEELAQKRAWEIFHDILVEKNVDIGYPQPVIDHFKLGLRERSIDKDTGEITREAVTVPYYVNGDVMAIEFRERDSFEYEGSTCLFEVQPMFEPSEVSSHGVILPDSLQAVDFYLSGDGNASIYGLPHSQVEIELPDKQLYCIFDTVSNIEWLELLDEYGVRFVKVSSLKQMMKVLSREQIEQIATRGKRLEGVI